MMPEKDEFYNFQLARTRVYSRLCFLLCVLCAFAGNASAQSNLDLLAEKINRGSAEQKRSALVEIRNLEAPEASRVALPALRDKSEIVRATAAASVVFLPGEEAAGWLLPLLRDKKEFVRKEAAYALGKTRSPLAVAPLVEILQRDKKLEVKSAAAVALGEIGDAGAVEPLTRILQTSRKAEEEFLRRAAARSVGQIAQIIQTGEAKVVTPESFILEENKIVKPPKYLRLIEIFPVFRSANSVLIQTLQNSLAPDDIRREAAFALGAIGDSSALPVLEANRNSPDYYLAEICVEAVRKISTNPVVINSNE